MNTQHNTPWFTKRATGTDPLFRLYCFPYGGSGSSIYRQWQDSVSDDIEVCPVQLPGRENRIEEPLATDMQTLLDNLLEHMVFDDDIPFAFFGHSMGGIIAFELAHYLRIHNMVEPVHLFISGSPLPSKIEEHARSGRLYHTLPDEEFLEFFLDRSNGIPDEVLLSEEMMRMILPILKADLGLMESFPLTYGCDPLPIPITAFGGIEDEMVVPQDIAKWENYTTASYTRVMFPGGHYFIHTSHDALLQHVDETAMVYMI